MAEAETDSEKSLREEVARLQQRVDAQGEYRELNRRIIEAMPGGLVHVLATGAIITANPEACRILGLSFDQLTQKYTADFETETIHTDGSICTNEEYPVTQAIVTGKAQPPMTIGVRKPDGSLSWAVFRAVPVKDDAGNVSGAVVTFLDVTENRAAYIELEQSQADMRRLIDNFPHFLFSMDRNGTILNINKSPDGQDKTLVPGHSFTDYIDEADVPMWRREMSQVWESGKSSRFESKAFFNDREFYLDVTLWLQTSAGEPQGFNLIAVDVSNQKRLNRQLTYHANHDFLTGLTNRFKFEIEAHRLIALARSKKLKHALLYIDLDQFKVVNDTCGHLAGDALLQRLAVLMKETAGEDVLIARLGGDEFGVIIQRASVELAEEFARNILRVIEGFTFQWKDQRFKVSASIGVVIIDEQTEGYGRALKDADMACFSAKEHGRNQIQFFTPDNQRIVRRKSEMLTVNSVKAALEEDRIELFAQKIQDFKDDGYGIEILSRIRSGADASLLAPGNFILTAERYDLMPRFDLHVVSNVLEVLLQNGGLPADIKFITVNLSGKSIESEWFHNKFFEILSSPGIPLDRLYFEITETAVITYLEKSRTFINNLVKMGTGLILDDFGSGVSSFGYLRHMPVTHVKIDGAFIKNMAVEAADLNIVTAINTLSRSLGKETIAEYVEDEKTCTMSKELGIGYAQGYYIHKPEPLKQLLD